MDKKNSNDVAHIGDRINEDLEFNHYIGIMLLSKRIFNYFDDKEISNIIYDIILPAKVNNNEKILSYSITNNNWHETGNLDGYLEASFKYLQLLIEQEKSEFSKELLNIFDFYKMKPILHQARNYRLLTLNKSHLEQNYQFNGSVILDQNTVLNKNYSISDSVLFNQTEITNESNNTFLMS